MKKIVILIMAMLLSGFVFATSVSAMEKLPRGATHTQVKERTDELFDRLRRLSVTELDSVDGVVTQYLIPSEGDDSRGWASSIAYYMITLVKAERGDIKSQLDVAKGQNSERSGAGRYLELCKVAELEKKTGKSWSWGNFYIYNNETQLKDAWKPIKNRFDLEDIRNQEKWYGIALKNPKANYKQKVTALLGLAKVKIVRARDWEDGTLSNEGELQRSIRLLNEAKQLALQAQLIARQNKDRHLYECAAPTIRDAEWYIKDEIEKRKQQGINQGAVKKFLQ